jgi:hypothetical protein
MKATIQNVNKTGLSEIAEFLGTRHKKAVQSGEGADYFTQPMLSAWAQQAEFQISEGNPASIELKAHESVNGYTEEFTISKAGLNAEEIEI